MASHNQKGRSKRLPPFIPVTISTWEHPVWKAMSPGPRLLYIALRRRLRNDLHNNGRVYLSYRDAMKELGVRSSDTIHRWFRELELYGFIVMTNPVTRGGDGRGKAPHWRLTELTSYGNNGKPITPTRDFEKWDGTKIKNLHQKSVLPAPDIGAPLHQKSVQLEPEVHQFSGHIAGQECTSFQDISRIPSTPRSPARPADSTSKADGGGDDASK